MDISSACHLLARLLLGVKSLFCHLSWAAVPSLFHFLFLGGTHTWTFGGPPGRGSLDFHLLSTSFLPSLPSCPPSPTVSITSVGPCQYLPLLLSPLCSWLACLESLPRCSKQSALPPAHIGAAGRCRRRSHSCSACCRQQFRPFTLPGLLTVSGASFSFLKLFTLFPKFAPGFSLTPVHVCFQCCLFISHSLCRLYVAPLLVARRMKPPPLHLTSEVSLWPGSHLDPSLLCPLLTVAHDLLTDLKCVQSGKHKLPGIVVQRTREQREQLFQGAMLRFLMDVCTIEGQKRRLVL